MAVPECAKVHQNVFLCFYESMDFCTQTDHVNYFLNEVDIILKRICKLEITKLVNCHY